MARKRNRINRAARLPVTQVVGARGARSFFYQMPQTACSPSRGGGQGVCPPVALGTTCRRRSWPFTCRKRTPVRCPRPRPTNGTACRPSTWCAANFRAAQPASGAAAAQRGRGACPARPNFLTAGESAESPKEFREAQLRPRPALGCCSSAQAWAMGQSLAPGRPGQARAEQGREQGRGASSGERRASSSSSSW